MKIKKRLNRLYFVSLVFILILSISLVSAGFSSWFKTITGRASTTQPVNLNVSVTTSAPKITFMTIASTVTPTEDSATNFMFNFTVNSSYGFQQINGSSAAGYFNQSGITRQNTSCLNLNNFSGTNANFSCTIQVWYFDSQGTWSVNATIRDTSNNVANNATATFSVNQLSALVLSPSSLTFPSLTPGAINQTATNNPLLLNNTGNKPITTGNIQINATDLIGETDTSKGIYAGNFSIGTVNSSTAAACDISGGPNNATIMSKGLFTAINMSNMTNGNNTINNNVTGQETLFFCINQVGSELTQQAYSTLSQGTWTTKII